MEPLELIIVLLCVLLGLGRGADLAFATDAAKAKQYAEQDNN